MISPSLPHFTGRQDALVVNWRIRFQDFNLIFSSLESRPAARPQRQQHVSHVFTPVPEHFYLPPWPTTVHRGSVCTCRLCVNMRVCLRNLPLVNVTQPLGKETFPPFYSRWPWHLWKTLRCFWAQGHYCTRWTQSSKLIETGSSVFLWQIEDLTLNTKRLIFEIWIILFSSSHFVFVSPIFLHLWEAFFPHFLLFYLPYYRLFCQCPRRLLCI